MSKEVMKKEKNELATYDVGMFDSELESVRVVNSYNLSLPRILLMQPGSPKVLEGTALFGEVRDNLSWEVLADVQRGDKPSKTILVSSFYQKDIWHLSKKDSNGKFVFHKIEEVNAQNQSRNPYNEYIDSENNVIRPQYTIVHYFMIPGKSLPYSVAFKGASRKAAQAINAFITEKSAKIGLEKWQRVSASLKIELIPKKMNKNNNSFIELEARLVGEWDFNTVVAAQTWRSQISKTNIDYQQVVEDDAHTGSNINTSNVEF